MNTLTSLFANEYAGLDIYETKNINTWISGQSSISHVSFAIGTIILIIIYLILIIFVPDKKFKIIATGIFLFILFGLFINSFVIVPKAAEKEYKRFNNEIQGTMASLKISREEAIRIIRDERHRRETTAVMREQADAMRSSHRPGLGQGLSAGVGFGVANALLNRV